MVGFAKGLVVAKLGLLDDLGIDGAVGCTEVLLEGDDGGTGARGDGETGCKGSLEGVEPVVGGMASVAALIFGTSISTLIAAGEDQSSHEEDSEGS